MAKLSAAGLGVSSSTDSTRGVPDCECGSPGPTLSCSSTLGRAIRIEVGVCLHCLGLRETTVCVLPVPSGLGEIK